MNILISACLMGVKCRYDGSGTAIENLNTLMEKYHLVPICPEILGGMSTPREPAEQVENRVITKDGKDVTALYQKGAEEVLKLAKMYHCRYAILKERSPSCGYGKVYDGTFSGTLIDGYGITAKLLADYGITVLGETKIRDIL